MSSEATSARSASDEKRRVQNREAQRNRRRNVRQQLAHYEQLLQTMGLASRADSNIRDRHHGHRRSASSSASSAAQDLSPSSPKSPLNGSHCVKETTASPVASTNGNSHYPSQQAGPQYVPQRSSPPAPPQPETNFYGVDTGLILSSLYEHERDRQDDSMLLSAEDGPVGLDADYGCFRVDSALTPTASQEYYPSVSESKGLVEMADTFSPPGSAASTVDRPLSYQQSWGPGNLTSSDISNTSCSPHTKLEDNDVGGDGIDVQMAQAPYDMHTEFDPSRHSFYQVAPGSGPFSGHFNSSPSAQKGINPQHLLQQQQQLPPAAHQTHYSPQRRPDSQGFSGRRTSWTPLHHATNSKNVGMMQLLIQNGAEITARDDEGNTALHLAARVGDIEIATCLLQHFRVSSSASQPSSDGNTTSSSNASSPPSGGESESQSSTTTESVSTPGSPQSAQQQATQMKGFVDVANVAGLTPLHLAVANGHASIAKMLIEAGADVNSRMPSS